MSSDYNQIYIKPGTSRAIAVWLASPSASYNYSLMNADYYGNMSSSYYGSGTYSPGLRPLVCLKSSVQLEKQSDGTFKIVKTLITGQN